MYSTFVSCPIVDYALLAGVLFLMKTTCNLQVIDVKLDIWKIYFSAP